MSDANLTESGRRWYRSGTLRRRQDQEEREKTKEYEAAVQASRYIDPDIEKNNVLTVEQKFHQGFQGFNKLPVEIRLKIWHLAIISPRLVQIRASKKLVVISKLEAVARWDRFVGKSWVLPQICKESRDEAFRLGSKLCFENRLKDPVFFDGSKDTLTMSPDVMRWFLRIEDLGLRLSQFRADSVKFLAIYPYDMKVHLDNEGRYSQGQGSESDPWRTIFNSMRAFGDLDEIYIIIERKEGFPIEEVQNELRDFVERRFDKEKRIWDMIREIHGRECRRYAVPKMLFLTLEELKTRRNIPCW